MNRAVLHQSAEDIAETFPDKNGGKLPKGSHSGTTQTISPNPQTIHGEPATEYQSQNKTIRKRKPKNTEGIWVIEKSLDRKNWIPERGILVMTRAEGEKLVGESNKNLFGIHYRLTRYEPSR